tara:strand:+ start:100 stop:492 length:393 start_codon:yes stop_codon:yes gene_type:complete
MKKNYLLPLLFTLFLVSSCSVTQQSYSFSHHGTDTIKSNADFKYVAHNVKGKAKTTIKMSAWKKMKQEMALDGLMSEAKSNLPKLTDNQAYANLSVDKLVTTTGQPTTGGLVVEQITIEVVVSTDIIQYE